MGAAAEEIITPDWTAALVAAAHELADVALGYPEGRVRTEVDEMGEELVTSFVPLINDGVALQVGVAASVSDTEELARAYLQFTTLDIEYEDVCDAIGEIANVLAGAVKRNMAGRGTPWALGHPTVTRGPYQPPAATDPRASVTLMVWGSVEATLLLLQQEDGG